MRILIVTALLLLALLAGGLVAASRLVVWDDYREELTARAEAMTGQSVVIRGPIDLDLLPQPTLTLAQTTLADRVDSVRLEVDRLDLELRPLPLLGGRLDVAGVRMVRPVLHVAPASDASARFMGLASAAAWLPLSPDGPSRLSVVDGRVILPQLAHGGVGQLDEVNVDLSTAGPSAAVVLRGTFALNRQPLRIDARIGRPNEDRSSTLRLELAAVGLGDAGTSALTFGGVVRWSTDTPRLRGELALTGADARSTIGTIGNALGKEVMAMPPWLVTPFRLAGRLGVEGDRIELTDVTLGVDGTELNGRLHLILAAMPEVRLQLQAHRLALPEASGRHLEQALGALLGLASAARGEIDLAVGTLELPRAAVRRVRASLQLSGAGDVTVSDARAVLPGETEIGFSGEVAGPETELRGTLTAVTRNLRATLAWLDFSVEGVVPEDRLNTLSLASEVSLRHGALRLRELDLRVDTTRVTGSAALDAAPRPQLAANLVLDRLDLDAYQPAGTLADLFAALAAPLRMVDAAIEARLARLTWRGVHLRDVRFGGRSVEERLRINQLTVGNLADAEAHVSGEVNLADGTFDVSGSLSQVHAPRLLRRLGVEPPPLLLRLQPLELEGTAKGTLEAAQVQLTVRDGASSIDVAGEIGWTGEEAVYQLDVAAEHPDYRSLLRDLGAGPRTAEAPAGRLALSGRVQRQPGGASSIAGTAWFGDTSFTGRVAWQGQERPHVDARISVGEPSAPVLVGLLEVSGLRLEWPGTDGGFRGRWSERPLALSLLEGLDGKLVLSGKGGLAGDALELSAHLANGELTVDNLSLALWGGRLQGQLSYDVARPLPYLVAGLDLENFEPDDLAAWLGVPPLLEGPADLHVEATGVGDNVRALVGSLIGEVELTVRGGIAPGVLPKDFAAPPEPQLDPAEPVAIESRMALERGALAVPRLDLAIGGMEARLDGVIDLYLWVVDLTVRAEDGPVLKLVGPLHRPQVRLTAAAGPDHASPALAP